MNNMDRMINGIIGKGKSDLFASIAHHIGGLDDAKSLRNMLSMFHNKAHKHGWKTDSSCGKFDRMMLICMRLGQMMVESEDDASSPSPSGQIAPGKLLSETSMNYVLSGLTGEPKEYYDTLTHTEQSCIKRIAEHAINERMKKMMQDHMDKNNMMQPLAMDGDAMFAMVMDAVVLTYRTGRHGQSTHALNETFTFVEESDT